MKETQLESEDDIEKEHGKTIMCKLSHLREKESEVAQSCLTLCNPKDHSPPGSSVQGIF